jgi:ABC-type multidrug transport system fused ATPase/permease subunit
MVIVAAVEAAGAVLFAVTVVTAALAPVGFGALLAVAVYASYAIGERFASLVEAHQEVDGTAQVLGRVSDMLTVRTLPRQRMIRRGPATAAEVMEWLAPAEPIVTGHGGDAVLVAEGLITAVPGRAGGRLDLSLRPGEFAAVRGGSGAGKSVLLRTLAGLSPAVSGAVLVAGRAPAPYERAGRAALRLVENDPPPLPVPVSELCSPFAAELASEWCVALGLVPADPAAPVGMLEPAQRQVVALAVACADGPSVLLVDETTSALDPAGERALLKLLRARLPGTAIVAVLHRPDNVDLADVEVLVSELAK